MIRIHEVSLPPQHSREALLAACAKLLRIAPADICSLTVVRRSVDARKKPDVRIVYTVDVAVSDEHRVLRRSGCRRAEIAKDTVYTPPAPAAQPALRPVVVGFGPAGMFAALILAQAGLRPIVLERGEDAAARKQKVERFFTTGVLDPQSNVQFGEGGAGTFSDGKLNTGVSDVRIGWVLRRFAAFGAGESILFDAKPHIGTDVLIDVVQNLRAEVIRLGGEVRFRTQVTDLLTECGALTGLKCADGGIIRCDHAIFAIGHSARDTVAMLHARGVPMEAKPFAIGARIEQPQRQINLAQYGAELPGLPPADYKLVCHLANRSVYTFCMCPGGYVVAAASEPGGVVTNGMSNARRDGTNANAALLASVTPADFPGSGPLAGMAWQREIEARAFAAAGGSYRAPAMHVGTFLTGRPVSDSDAVVPTYRPGVVWTDLGQVLPPCVTDALREALPILDTRLHGFAAPGNVLTAPETRSSSPVRLLRGADRQSALHGLYPAGEGAGYAGGIVSAAVDGIRSAEALIAALAEQGS